jgi:hypothetical protein
MSNHNISFRLLVYDTMQANISTLSMTDILANLSTNGLPNN